MRIYSFLSKSPFPIMLSMSAFLTMMSFIIFMKSMMSYLLLLNFLLLLFIIFLWGNSVLSEYLYLGFYDLNFYKCVKMGMLFFIFSEIMFFMSFFSSFLFFSLTQKLEFGLKWFCLEEFKVNFMSIPMLNTLILLYSGFILTLAHMKIILMKKSNKILIFLTLLLGFLFLLLQLYEYKESVFCLNDSVFGNCFFLYTSFHGFHVLIGFSLLFISFLFSMKMFFSNKKLVYFEMSAWYWHFVDVVWLFLFFLLYTWNMTF
uniref:cytochrome c oxidase subunit III n=1 Tax=Intoshia linei TaxID=1819745 RepID=UPI001EE05998|nr:cytochrome c oxidase subunit III [Intoshia linei]UIB41621.1 cytochrome c oxidase subunit 3 [Intoshia linei]